MRENFSLSALSLRTKLVLSYLVVILGTVLVLSFAVSSAAQTFFVNIQTNGLRDTATSTAQSLKYDYIRANGNWLAVADHLSPFTNNYIFAVVDATGNQVICIQPNATDDCKNADVVQALSQTVQTQKENDGIISIFALNTTISSVYVSIPLQLHDGQLIGAMILSEPLLSGEFMQQINQAIFLSGLAIAIIAGISSFLLIRRFTRPLKSLTRAAEQMKEGRYVERVTVPKRLDELGELALTFNEMADTIVADINELRRQDQVRRDLIANIAHDLATPLTAIQGFSEALADDVITAPQARQETGQRIRREIQRLQRLISDVKQVSSLEAGHVQLDLAPLDMHTLVDETLAVIEPECIQAEIAVHNEIAPSTPPVLADSDRITQVLLNLLDNARRHTPAGGQLIVGARIIDRFVQIWVKDTGSGIDPADLPHIFERFYRADRSRATATGGSGLGLAIVKAIISAHGGAIWAESSPGEGTCITFALPNAAEPITVNTRLITATHHTRPPTLPNKEASTQ